VTTPSPSQDIPLAEVKIGLSEITVILSLICSAVTAIWGDEWDLSAKVPQVAAYAVVLLPIGLAIARAIKHHGVARANAIVIAAQPLPIPLPGGKPAGPPPETFPPGDAGEVVEDPGAPG